MFKISRTVNYRPVELTANEVSNIWSSYMKSSMELCLFEYFFATTEEDATKQIVEKMLDQAKKSLKDLKEIFHKENLSLPIGFTNEDVFIGANKVFSDSFILSFCYDLTMLSMSTYPSALTDSTRKDVRNYFQTCIQFSVNIQNEIIELMIVLGEYSKSPQVVIDDRVEFADSILYLNGILGGSRPLNTPEIANLSRVIHRAQFSKMVFVAFSKLAKAKDLKKHFSKGRDVIEKALDSLNEILEKENIPISTSHDYEIFDDEVAPFSDKLMLYFVNTCLGVFCFAMISQATTSSLRTDVVTVFTKITSNMKNYYGKGLIKAIDEKWLEQPPQAVDRRI